MVVVFYAIIYSSPGRNDISGSAESLSFNPVEWNRSYNVSDSTFADSTFADTLEFDPRSLDSTARLKYFRFQRTDPVVVPIFEKKKSSFFVYPSARYFRRTIELDSTGQFVIIKETVAGNETKELMKLPLDVYVKLRMENLKRKSWEKIAYKYELKEDANDLGKILSEITNIEIPLPETSILSIFGPPKISLKINGSVNIHGAWRNEKTEGLTASRLGNTRNEPDFKQTVQINVKGTIGDKLSIGADWNTERTFEYENQLKLKYTGYDDEIIQSIEAGNVSLQTSPLVGGSEALFGVKAKFQLGPFSLTALASQKKSEIQEVSVSGGSERQTFEIHAYDYSENHYFLDTLYASREFNIFNNVYGYSVPKIGPIELYNRVKDLEVWKTVSGIVNSSKERNGNAFINLRGRVNGQTITDVYDDSLRSSSITQENGKNVIGGRFVRLVEGIDYDYDPYAGFITFKTQIQPIDAIGVAYRIEGENGPEDIYFGEFIKEVQSDTSKTIILKLVKPPNLQPKFKQAWKLQLKNIYPIGGRDVNKEGFKMEIRYIIEGQDPTDNINGKQLVTIFGLDKTDESGTSPDPDGAFDFLAGQTILPQTGEIVFPVLEPFGRDLPPELSPDLAYNSVYDTTKTFAQQDRSKDKFLMTGEYSASTSSVYNIGFNVVENSVRVTLNGRELKAGIDYSVDYSIGQVIIRNDAALVPGANLKITYEQNDLFQLASKTLLGFRGLYEFNKKTKLGFSFLNLNQQTLSDKVRIGEEPLNNSILGLDFQSQIDLPFVTKGLDYLFSTKEMSSISLKGEFAYMSPDPNTKKSTIASDGGKSIAYIDDFEGAKRIIPIGVSYTGWRDLSVPDNIPTIPEPLDKQDLMSYKGKSYWYNVLPSNVFVEDIWGNRKSVAREDRQVTVLDYVFDPSKRGTYNKNPKLSDPKKMWGGIMRLLSSTANNLVEENIEFIEFYLNMSSVPDNAKLYIDLGQISEDVIPNGILDTEDKNQNDLVDEGEDTGIDGIIDAQERALDSLNLGNDPANDNFAFTLSNNPDYSRINGTEGNAALTDVGRLPDTEDLNRNFTLDRLNSYFRYEVKLDSTSDFIAGGGDGKQKWYLFRVPLKDFIEKVGDPTFTLVEFIRFWVTGLDQPLHLRFAELNLVGNQWQKVLQPGVVDENDTVLTISTINIEDNPEYSSPPGVFQERDRSKPDQEVFKNEQSLQIKIKELEQGDRREIVKYLYRPIDLFNYREMKLFVHGEVNDADPNSVSHYDPEEGYNSQVYFRFGSDSLNYYEYRQPVQAGWKEIAINFAEITAIKQTRDSSNMFAKIPVPGKEGHFYGVRGNPTLTKISFFTFGIYNPIKKSPQPADGRVSGEIWVNELRVIGADDSPGWAYSTSASVKFADILSIKANMSQTDPFFHKLSDRFGSRVDKKSWGVSVDLDVTKLIPLNMKGSNFRVNYSHTESIAKPLYKPGTDIKVDEAAVQEKEKLMRAGLSEQMAQKIADQIISQSQTIRISDTWTLSNIQFKLPYKSWWADKLINNIALGFNYNKSTGRNPTTLRTYNWVWNASAKYSLNFSRDNFFYPANIPIIGKLVKLFKDYRNVKVYYTPQSFNTSFSANRKSSFQQSRADDKEGIMPKPAIQRDFTTKRNMAFSWKITDGGFLNIGINYKLDIAASLANLLITPDGRERSEKELWNDIFNGVFFGRDYQYSQSVDFQTKPKLPTLWNLDRYFKISGGYNVNYKWQNNFNQEDLGRAASFSNRITAGLTLKLKSLFAPLFKKSVSKSSRIKGRGRSNIRGRGRINNRIGNNSKTPAKQESQEDSTVAKIPVHTKILNLLVDATKWLFFDYDNINLKFSQNNSMSGNGLRGTGTGFNNFWGIRQQKRFGPTRLFMLGLSFDIGQRAPNGNLSDKFSQKNNISFKTRRPLWEGADIDLSWDIGWGINKNTSISTDALGNVTVDNLTSNGTLDRSFFSMPKFLFFDNGIIKVAELYKKAGGASSDNPNQTLSDAFVHGLETFPLLSKIPFLGQYARYIPRPNWRISWNGLEKLDLFKGFAKSVSLSHAYTSKYSEGWRINPDGIQETQNQKITYGFSPLIGMNVTFNKLWDGNLSGSIKYSAKTSYDLGISTRNITESFSRDITVTASFNKSGFKIPLFGLSLKNDIELSVNYTSGKNSVIIYEMDNFKEQGKPQEGTTRTTLEPRVKYVMSSRVTLSVYYKRTTVEPEGASRIPPTTTNEAGLDVSIAIQ